jgi:hypothetical protein
VSALLYAGLLVLSCALPTAPSAEPVVERIDDSVGSFGEERSSGPRRQGTSLLDALECGALGERSAPLFVEAPLEERGAHEPARAESDLERPHFEGFLATAAFDHSAWRDAREERSLEPLSVERPEEVELARSRAPRGPPIRS